MLQCNITKDLCKSFLYSGATITMNLSLIKKLHALDLHGIGVLSALSRWGRSLVVLMVAAILAVTAELASLQAQINDLKKQINGENDFDLTVDKEKYSQTLIESVLGQYLKKVEL